MKLPFNPDDVIVILDSELKSKMIQNTWQMEEGITLKDLKKRHDFYLKWKDRDWPEWLFDMFISGQGENTLNQDEWLYHLCFGSLFEKEAKK